MPLAVICNCGVVRSRRSFRKRVAIIVRKLLTSYMTPLFVNARKICENNEPTIFARYGSGYYVTTIRQTDYPAPLLYHRGLVDMYHVHVLRSPKIARVNILRDIAIFRLDALALSVIATATWLGLGGWVAGCLSQPVLYQND